MAETVHFSNEHAPQGGSEQGSVRASALDLNHLLANVFAAILLIDAVVTIALSLSHPRLNVNTQTGLILFLLAHPALLALGAVVKIAMAFGFRRVLLWLARWYDWQVSVLIAACSIVAAVLVAVDLLTLFLSTAR